MGFLYLAKRTMVPHLSSASKYHAFLEIRSGIRALNGSKTMDSQQEETVFQEIELLPLGTLLAQCNGSTSHVAHLGRRAGITRTVRAADA
jgi:hypothetical protein